MWLLLQAQTSPWYEDQSLVLANYRSLVVLTLRGSRISTGYAIERRHRILLRPSFPDFLLRTNRVMLILPHPSIPVEAMFFRTIAINHSSRNALPARPRADQMPAAGLVNLAADEHIARLFAQSARLAVGGFRGGHGDVDE